MHTSKGPVELKPCLHTHAVPVELHLTGELVAWLCPDCDAQLPEDFRRPLPAALYRPGGGWIDRGGTAATTRQAAQEQLAQPEPEDEPPAADLSRGHDTLEELFLVAVETMAHSSDPAQRRVSREARRRLAMNPDESVHDLFG